MAKVSLILCKNKKNFVPLQLNRAEIRLRHRNINKK